MNSGLRNVFDAVAQCREPRERHGDPGVQGREVEGDGGGGCDVRGKREEGRGKKEEGQND
jgi:hypothetical protein